MNMHWIEVECEDGSRARLRADEITAVMERKTAKGQLVTIPTRAKTLQTVHTMDDLWQKIKDAHGGVHTLCHKVPHAPFPPAAEEKPAPIPRRPKANAA